MYLCAYDVKNTFGRLLGDFWTTSKSLPKVWTTFGPLLDHFCRYAPLDFLHINRDAPLDFLHLSREPPLHFLHLNRGAPIDLLHCRDAPFDFLHLCPDAPLDFLITPQSGRPP